VVSGASGTGEMLRPRTARLARRRQWTTSHDCGAKLATSQVIAAFLRPRLLVTLPIFPLSHA